MRNIPVTGGSHGIGLSRVLTGFRALTWSGSGLCSKEFPPMWKAVLPVASVLMFSIEAEAHPQHHHHDYRSRFLQSMASAVGDERIVGNRPSECPQAFCGCEASLFRFGRIIPQLNLASNWRRFPRAAPAPGMAAVRFGHVMILQQHVDGDIWYVHDGNSGGDVTREHPRSIAGYTIVDPSSVSFTSAGPT
jgi:hypothetical protein